MDCENDSLYTHSILYIQFSVHYTKKNNAQVTKTWTKASLLTKQYDVIIVRSRKVPKPRDLNWTCFDRSEIWQASLDNIAAKPPVKSQGGKKRSNMESCSFAAWRDFKIICLPRTWWLLYSEMNRNWNLQIHNFNGKHNSLASSKQYYRRLY